MAGTSDSDGSPGDSPTIPIHALPDPSVHVSEDGDAFVLAQWNGPFGERFSIPDSNPTLDDWWEDNGLRSTTADWPEIRESLSSGRDVDEIVKKGSTPAEESHNEFRLRSTHVMSATEADVYLFATPLSRSNYGTEVDQIASIVSHDLRNPLDVAKAHLREARETTEDEHFRRVAEAHDRMELIINDVLTLAKDSELVEESAEVELEEIAKKAWQTVETGNASLIMDDELSSINADTDRLQRLLENLFRNSIEHGQLEDGNDDGDSDTATVVVRLEQTDTGFIVADNGPGIDPVERDHVFEPGYTTDRGGTGLGLTIVNRIAEAHGWTVSLGEDCTGGVRFEIDVCGEQE